MIVTRSILFGFNRLQKKGVEKIKTQLFVKNIFLENRIIHEKITANTVTPERPKIRDTASHTS
jgi:hypothetical protein